MVDGGGGVHEFVVEGQAADGVGWEGREDVADCGGALVDFDASFGVVGEGSVGGTVNVATFDELQPESGGVKVGVVRDGHGDILVEVFAGYPVTVLVDKAERTQICHGWDAAGDHFENFDGKAGEGRLRSSHDGGVGLV